jgi:hypothetical protein
MPKISELEHVSILMDGRTCKKKVVRENTGSGPVKKSPMLKSDYFTE